MSHRLLTVLGCPALMLLMAGPAEGASYEVLAEKARASVAAAEKAGARLLSPPEGRDIFTGHSGWPDAGGIPFYPEMGEPLIDMPPTNDDLVRRPWVMLSQDEATGVVLAASVVRSATVELRARLVDLAGHEAKGLGVRVRPIVFGPVADRRRQSYRMQGLWLADPRPVPVEEGRLVAWFIGIKARPEAEPGEYRLKIEIPWENPDPAGMLTDTLRVTVLPIRLTDPARQGYTFGAFCAGADFSKEQFRQMEKHGLDAFLFFWGHFDIRVQNRDGRLVLDLSRMDEMVRRFKEAGLYGPITIALGNDASGHLERAIAEAFDLPMQPRVEREGKVVRLATLDDPRMEQRLVEALSQLFEHAAENNWPEIVILPYDEPTERLMDEHRRMVRLFRKHFPAVRLYGVTMNRLAWAEQVLDTDILVANGDWGPIRDLAREHGKGVWFYRSITAAGGFGAARARTGLETYAWRPDGEWFWSYNFYVDDPWNEFDGDTPDSAWVICWPPLEQGGESVSTPAYEGLREGVNDVRYAMTLEQVLGSAQTPTAERIRRQYDAWRERMQQSPPAPADLPAARAQLIRWTLEVMGRPLPQGFERRFGPATQPADRPAEPAAETATQPAGFAPVENEQM